MSGTIRVREKTCVVHVILNDWLGYPPFRKKKLMSGKVISVGAGSILTHIQRVSAGIPFQITAVLNEVRPFPDLRWIHPRHWRNLLTAKRKWTALLGQFPFVTKIIFRPNIDFDFGAYDTGYQHLRSLGYDGDVLFMNSSLQGPEHDGWLKKYQSLFYQHTGVGLCGSTLNAFTGGKDPVLPHVQSFTMFTNMKVLCDVFPQHLYQKALRRKRDAIMTGEVAMSQVVLDHGYGLCCVAFPDFVYRRGDVWDLPFVVGWRKNPELARFANII